MALYVNTNISSLNAQRKLANSTLALNTSYQRLSSGFRINSAKDDAAGLQISNRLTAQINGLNQGNRNTNDGIALAQTVEGAMDETTNMLQRIRTLAVQAANGTNTQKDRESLQQEVTALCEEISRIAVKTTFAGAQVLDGTPNTGDNSLINDDGKIIFQVGANHDDIISLDLSSGFTLSAIATASRDAAELDAQDLKSDPHGALIKASAGSAPTFASGKVTWNVTTYTAAQATLAYIDGFIEYVDSKRAELGAIQNRMESTIRNQSSIAENEADARSRIRDTDFAAETANLTSNNIIQQASQSILAQANQRPQVALSLLGQ